MIKPDVIRNWETAKLLILKKWDKLKEKELEHTQGRFEDVVKVVERHYDLSRGDVEAELINLTDQILKPS